MAAWDSPGKYLGLPAEWGRSKSSALNWIKLRVLDKIDGWKEKLLNQAGKEVLIKSVLQAIASYAMAIIRFPINFCQSISSQIARFGWRRLGKERGIHWKDWKSISKAKGRGGLGFKDFTVMNTSLLSKQVSKAIQNPQALWVQILKGLYFPNSDILKAQKKRGGSWGWHSILQGRDFLRAEGRWLVGNGKDIKVWKDKWLGPSIIQLPPGGNPEQTVDSLMLAEQIQWDMRKLSSHLGRQLANQAIQIPLRVMEEDDQFCWPHSKDGLYSVKQGIKWPTLPNMQNKDRVN